MRVVAAEPGHLVAVPSARPAHSTLPARPKRIEALTGPAAVDSNRKQLTGWATPSPCPPHHVVLTAARSKLGAPLDPVGNFGIYLSDHDSWGNSDDVMTLLFDDPDLVDAEPVAVYARHSKLWATESAQPIVAPPAAEKKPLTGTVFNSGLYAAQHADLPGQKTDTGEGPIFAPPPKDSLHTIRVYASRRDRFDDPLKLRIDGAWELLVEAPTKGDSVGMQVPAGVPTVLAGFDKDGRVVRWTTPAKDSAGKQATFYAFAGDHYSATQSLGTHFCIGCHPGHSSLAKADHHHAEKIK